MFATTACASIREWYNELDRVDENGEPVYDLSVLEQLASGPKVPHSKAIAARDIIQARDKGWDTIRRQPSGANSQERIMDRTEGKATMRIQMEHRRTRSIEELEREIVLFVGQDDTLLDNPHAKMMLLQSARQSRTLREALRPIIENRCPEMLAALEPVNVAAKVIDESDSHEVADGVATETVVRDIERMATVP